MSESPAPFEDDLYDASPEPSGSRRRTANQPSMSPSPSPATSVSSDKENTSSRADKGKGLMPMGPARVPSPSSDRSKRKRVPTMESATASGSERYRRRRTVETDENQEPDYDPDQDIEERRRLRKGLRDLTKNISENRSEWLARGSTGLMDTLRRADKLADQVKQTSDATIDARLLVTTADLSLKKTIALTSGDAAQGVDLDKFLSKCKSFMTNAIPGHDEGDMLNWAHLGRYAATQHIMRPPVPGFLLGPLSVEKRAKRVVVRKAALNKNSLQETRPEVLKSSDIEKSQNQNLTTLCTQILRRANKVMQDEMAAAEAEFMEDMTEDEKFAMLDRHGISENGGLALFKFVINPHCFGQTVENMFYVSFLIRDGKAGITVDDRGLPYLELTPEEGTQKEPGYEQPSKHQAVLSLDMATWQELIEVFDIQEPMIMHREQEEYSSVGKKGWYA